MRYTSKAVDATAATSAGGKACVVATAFCADAADVLAYFVEIETRLVDVLSFPATRAKTQETFKRRLRNPRASVLRDTSMPQRRPSPRRRYCCAFRVSSLHRHSSNESLRSRGKAATTPQQHRGCKQHNLTPPARSSDGQGHGNICKKRQGHGICGNGLM